MRNRGASDRRLPPPPPPIAGVHDSYWTHAASVDEMGAHLRQQFLSLHSRVGASVKLVWNGCERCSHWLGSTFSSVLEGSRSPGGVERVWNWGEGCERRTERSGDEMGAHLRQLFLSLHSRVDAVK